MAWRVCLAKEALADEAVPEQRVSSSQWNTSRLPVEYAVDDYTHCSVALVNDEAPSSVAKCFADDLTAVNATSSPEQVNSGLQHSFNLTERFVRFIGGQLSISRSHTFGHELARGVGGLSEHYDMFRLLGGSIAVRHPFAPGWVKIPQIGKGGFKTPPFPRKIMAQ